MAATYEELMAKARALKEAGQTDEARRVAEIALTRRTNTSRGEDAPVAPAQPDSFGTKFKEFFLGDDDPTTQNLGEKIGTAINTAGESLTFGLIGDEAGAAVDAALGRGTYDDRLEHYRDQEQMFADENPLAYAASVMAPALLPAGAMARGIGSAANLAGQVGRGILGGAAGGATYGFMEGEEGAANRLEGARDAGMVGGVLGGAAPLVARLVGAGVRGLEGKRAMDKLVKQAPTTEARRAEASGLYKQIDDAGVSIRPDKIGELKGTIQDYLRSEGAGFKGAETVLPASRAILQSADDVAAKSNTVPWNELDMWRRYIGNAAGSNLQNAGDTRAATGALTRLDEFVQGLTDADIDAGDIGTLQSLLPKARELWAKASKSQMLDDAMENAADYRTGTASGLRAQFQRIVKNPKLSRGFTDDELKIMRRVVNGTLPEQIINYLGSGLGMLGQMGGAAAGGAAMGGPLGAVAGAAIGTIPAAASRRIAEKLVRNNAERARAVVASGSGLPVPQSPKVNPEILRLLMAGSAPTGMGMTAGPQ